MRNKRSYCLVRYRFHVEATSCAKSFRCVLACITALFCFWGVTFPQTPSPLRQTIAASGFKAADKLRILPAIKDREKPNLNWFFKPATTTSIGASRLLFSPDGRLLATGTYRSNTIKLWETATNRKLRDLSSSGQAVSALAPTVAFSRDSRLVAASGGDNSVTVWDVMSGRELYKLGGSSQGSIMASLGVYFIAFTSDNRLVTISDAAASLGSFHRSRTAHTSSSGMAGIAGFNGSDSGLTLSPDGTQLLLITEGSIRKSDSWISPVVVKCGG